MQTNGGLHQGCLSSLLFDVHIEYVLKEWKRNCAGMGIPVRHSFIFTLNFTADQIIIAQDNYDLEFMISVCCISVWKHNSKL